jgi:hypothetical protein
MSSYHLFKNKTDKIGVAPIDPVHACISYDPFTSTGTKYNNPSDEGCQYLLVEKCSKDWDGVCDTYYINRSFDTTRFTPSSLSILQTQSCPQNSGHSFLVNTAVVAFFDNIGAEYTEPLNPLDPSSVSVTKYQRSNFGFQNLTLSSRLNSNNIDTHPIIIRLLNAQGNDCLPFLKMLFDHLVLASQSRDPRLTTTKVFKHLFNITRLLS